MTGILFGPISVEGRGELGLLLGGRGRFGGATGRGRGGGDSSRSGGGHAVALLEALDELGQLENGHLVDRFEQIVLGQDCHVVSLLGRVVVVGRVGARLGASVLAAFWSATCCRA